MEHSWRSWRPSQQPLQAHSNEVEHRLTRFEVFHETQEKLNAKFKTRLRWIERALKLMSGILIMVVNGKAHDYVPTIVDLLMQVLGTMR